MIILIWIFNLKVNILIAGRRLVILKHLSVFLTFLITQYYKSILYQTCVVYIITSEITNKLANAILENMI